MPSSSVRKKMQWWRRKRGEYLLPSSSSCTVVSDENGGGTGDGKGVIEIQRQSTTEEVVEANPTIYNSHEQSLMSERDASKKASKKERKKKINATIPCRFYNQRDGCWRGDRCMFLHSKIPLIENRKEHSNTLDVPTNTTSKIAEYNSNGPLARENDIVDTDMMDELTNQIQTKVQISIPSKISFGRRRGK